jgi:hypothetical protein
MDSSVAGTDSDDFFLWRHLKEHVYAVPHRTIEDLVARLQEAVTTVDANMLGVFERMPCSALPSALKWTDAASKTYCNYEAPMVSLFDSLRHLTVTCILKTKHHRTYVENIYGFFLTRNHTMVWLCAKNTIMNSCLEKECPLSDWDKEQIFHLLHVLSGSAIHTTVQQSFRNVPLSGKYKNLKLFFWGG